MKNYFTHEKMKELDDHLTTPVLVIIGLTLLVSTCILFDKKRDVETRYQSLIDETSGLREEAYIWRAEVDKLNILIGEKEQVCKLEKAELIQIIKEINVPIPINKEDK